jgi:hypothetical protein
MQVLIWNLGSSLCPSLGSLPSLPLRFTPLFAFELHILRSHQATMRNVWQLEQHMRKLKRERDAGQRQAGQR